MSHLEHVLVEVVTLGDLPVQAELTVRGQRTIEAVGLADRQKFTLLLQRGGEAILCLSNRALQDHRAGQHKKTQPSFEPVSRFDRGGVPANHVRLVLVIAQARAVIEGEPDLISAQRCGEVNPRYLCVH